MRLAQNLIIYRKSKKFLSYHHEARSKSQAHELIILTKFYDDSTIIVDFQLVAKF